MVAHKIKVSKILKMIQWNYQLTRQNWLVCELGTVTLFHRLWFQYLPSDLKTYWIFWETSPNCEMQPHPAAHPHLPISRKYRSTAVPPPPIPRPHGVGTESTFFLDLHVKILGLMNLLLIHHSLQLQCISLFFFSNHRGGEKSSYLAASKSSSFLYSPIYK